LDALADDTSGEGPGLFHAIARHLANATGMRQALVAELTGPNNAAPLGWWGIDSLTLESELELAGPLDEAVHRGEAGEHLNGDGQPILVDSLGRCLGAGAWLVAPLGAPGERIGFLCAFEESSLGPNPKRLSILRAFAARAGPELARQKVERGLAESQIYRDLYEEAPIAYVREDLESRLISANGAALRILGLKADEVTNTFGASLVPDTPDAQRRVREALASVGRGTDTSGVVLELRRKDDGRPVWIQWWSKPETNGKYTRTMFIDITDRVLMEQEQSRLRAQNLYLQEEIKSVHNFEEIVGQSPSLRTVLAKVDRVAKTDATVLLTGETGTGKELIARVIHSISRRSEKPLIKLNCAVLPTGLVESELFGHEKGAFSGALQRRLGRFELANGGTIFLDEIGEMPPEAQVKLLRVLQEHEFERVGGSETLKTDVRVIAATNRDLRRAVQEGTFREDLFYRLNVFPVELPPLRDRGSDIALLVRFFIEKYAAQIDRHIESIAPETMDQLLSYRWPGNVRELENLVERAMILANGTELRIEPEIFGSAGPRTEARKDLHTLQKEHILEALHRADWVIEGEGGAAKQLGLHPNTLRSRIKKLGIRRLSTGPSEGP
jgi:PAS domain S-box-containing protein